MRGLAFCLGFVSVLGCSPSEVRPAATVPDSKPTPETRHTGNREEERNATRQAAGVTAFTPGSASSARKARLLELAPKLDAFFRAKVEETGATGLAVGVVLEGELVYARGFGSQDAQGKTPINQDSVFRIASMTKSFTALAILKLRDEGKLSLDDPAERYLPELAALKPPTRDAPAITLRHLLTNASGLAYDDLWGAVTFGRSEAQLSQLIRNGVQLATTPGTRYAYSNLGWALLGEVVGRVSKLGYRSYVTQNILRPLGMTSSVWQASEVPAGRLAVGYRRAEKQLVEEPRPEDGAFAAAGGLYTSLHDYARYLSYQLAAYPPRDDDESGPVRRSTLREMHEGQRWARGDKDSPILRLTDDSPKLGVASYGFGWLNASSCTDEGRVQHGGFEPGYYGWVVMRPEARLGFVALATSGPVGITARFGVFDILREAGLLAAPEPVPHPALVAAAKALPLLLESWQPELAARTFDPDSLKYSWNQGLEQRFATLAHDHGRCQADQQLKVYGPLHADLRLSCERGAILFDLLMSPDKEPRIQQAGLSEELVPDERTDRIAKALAAAIGRPDHLSANLIAPDADRSRFEQTLRRAGLSFSACVVEHGANIVTVGPWGIERAPRYQLRCAGTQVELTFALDDRSGKLKSFAAYRPRAPEGLCWE